MEVHPTLLKTLLIMGSVIEARDEYTGGHTWRVGQYAKALAQKAGMDQSSLFVANLGGFLHDLGKISVPDGILNKEGKLDDPEYAVIMTHPEIGHTLLQDHPLADLVLDAVVQHHERPDGKGYPYHLEAEQISVYAKIVGIGDAFDAMTSTRPYRKGMPKEKALEILRQGAGSQFDAALVQEFLALDSSGFLDHIIGHSDENRPLLTCPMCGPIIAISRLHKMGEPVYCTSCKGEFEAHPKGESFELEFKRVEKLKIAPKPDLGTIGDLVQMVPQRLDLAPRLTEAKRG